MIETEIASASARVAGAGVLARLPCEVPRAGRLRTELEH